MARSRQKTRQGGTHPELTLEHTEISHISDQAQNTIHNQATKSMDRPCHVPSATPCLEFLWTSLRAMGLLCRWVLLWPCEPQHSGSSFTFEPPPPLVRGVGRRRRGSVLDVARCVICFWEPAFVSSNYFSCRGSHMQWQPGRAHSSAGAELRPAPRASMPYRAELCTARRAWVP
jgi:hypothetical protein